MNTLQKKGFKPSQANENPDNCDIVNNLINFKQNGWLYKLPKNDINTADYKLDLKHMSHFMKKAALFATLPWTKVRYVAFL
ncbi:hypothetical protein [Flavilitoribacter nigricans]|uniref:Uncharacterized protein n=1 Tax=Flavilitoribacter nigricans (strain ATCC 23147 / DSM 23189 / NBRC 102662 / NCIMB 1420 / SS-2) TaxID=1122177 RepID=A0A2D0N8D6_FLAN2|nr:hypothetical protein [Flavilitoribacter nigricans]PHN04650.1 hypothetical protein CRP01_19210 [Flavilitoribacter nigricans DSM 23189 = NBRC 102662]